MNIDILDQGAFASLLVRLKPGEEYVSESGAMFRASPNIDVDVTTKSAGSAQHTSVPSDVTSASVAAAVWRWLARPGFMSGCCTAYFPSRVMLVTS